MSKIEIKDLHFGYNEKDDVLNGLNLSIERGEYVCLLGHNGSGKSTLSKLIMGFLLPSQGSIAIDGVVLNSETYNDLREHIGIIFQNPDNQFVGQTVEDDIAFGLENRMVPSKKIKEIVFEYASLVGMEDFLSANPENLSGGQKQRVAIASVLAYNPDIIIFDEATSMLDPSGVSEVMMTMKSLIGKKTIISITHNLNEALLCDRVVILNEGKVVLEGKPSEVFKNKEILESSGLDTTLSMKLIDLLKNDKSISKENLKKVEDALWELTFKM